MQRKGERVERPVADLQPLTALAEENDSVGMTAQSVQPLMTAEELEHLYLPNKSTELVRGRLVVREPPSTRHGTIQATLTYFVTGFVRQHRLGTVVGQDTGFKIASDPDTVRAPDLAFIALARASQIPERGYAALVPDLVVEIVCPDDRPGELLAKVGEWLDAGARLVWVIDLRRREARVHRADGTLAVVGAGDMLDGEDLLPGFRCELAEVLGEQ